LAFCISKFIEFKNKRIAYILPYPLRLYLLCNNKVDNHFYKFILSPQRNKLYKKAKLSPQKFGFIIFSFL